MKMNNVKKLAITASLIFASSSVFAMGDGVLVRIRGIDAVPALSSSTISGIGGKVTHVSSSIVPELDISYFFTPHLSTELILATTRHNVSATGTAVGTVNLGKVSLLPPTLTLQYHFLPSHKINPYIGAGINYTYFYDINSGPIANKITYSDSFGPALQAGVDFALSKHWRFNIDVKKIFITTNANVTVGSHTYTTKVRLNPMIYGVGIGYRFS